MSIGFPFAATWPTFPTFNGSRLKCPCKKDHLPPLSSQEFRRLPRDEDTLSALENVKGSWPEPQRSAEGSSQMRVNATPGCDANP